MHTGIIIFTHFYICRVLAKRDYTDGRQSNAQYDNVRRHNYGASRMPGKRMDTKNILKTDRCYV